MATGEDQKFTSTFLAITASACSKLTVEQEASSLGLSTAALQQAVEITDIDLDREIEQHDMYILAGSFDNPTCCIHLFELQPAESNDVQRIFDTKGTRDAITHVLTLWKQRNPLQATYKSLIDKLASVQRGDIAEQVCKHLKRLMSKSCTHSNGATRRSCTHSNGTTHMYNGALNCKASSHSESHSGSSSNSDMELSPADSDDSEGLGSDQIASDCDNLYDFARSNSRIQGKFPIRQSFEGLTEQIKCKFSELIVTVSRSMDKNQVPVDDLILFLATLEALSAVSTCTEKPCLLFSHDYIRELEAECTSVRNVFLKLRGYYSWFNYHFIESIINVFCNNEEEVKKQLNDYKRRMRSYCKRRVWQLPKKLNGLNGRKEGIQKCVFKVDREWNTMRINQLEPVKDKIRKILKLKKQSLILRTVQKGCVELIFDMPVHVMDVLFPLSEEQVLALRGHGIRYVEAENEPTDTDHVEVLDRALQNVKIGRIISDTEEAELNEKQPSQTLLEEQENGHQLSNPPTCPPLPSFTSSNVVEDLANTVQIHGDVKITFDMIRLDAYLFDLFQNFLKDEGITNNLNFWLACEHYANLASSKDQQHLLDVANDLYIKFIKSSAEQHVTLLKETKKTINLSLKAKVITLDLFTVAQNEIYEVIARKELQYFLSFISNKGPKQAQDLLNDYKQKNARIPIKDFAAQIIKHLNDLIRNTKSQTSQSHEPVTPDSGLVSPTQLNEARKAHFSHSLGSSSTDSEIDIHRKSDHDTLEECHRHDQKKSSDKQLQVPESHMEHSQVASSTMKGKGHTLVVYHQVDRGSTPFAMRVPGPNITLRDFREKVLKRSGNFRFFFKRYLEGAGEYMEVSEESTVLPLFQGKIIGRVERTD